MKPRRPLGPRKPRGVPPRTSPDFDQAPLPGGSYRQTASLWTSISNSVYKVLKATADIIADPPLSPNLTLTSSRLQSIRPALLGCRQTLRTLHHWHTREKARHPCSGASNVEIWNRAEDYRYEHLSFRTRRQYQMKAFEPQPASAHRESRSKSRLLEARLAHKALSRGENKGNEHHTDSAPCT